MPHRLNKSSIKKYQHTAIRNIFGRTNGTISGLINSNSNAEAIRCKLTRFRKKVEFRSFQK